MLGAKADPQLLCESLVDTRCASDIPNRILHLLLELRDNKVHIAIKGFKNGPMHRKLKDYQVKY